MDNDGNTLLDGALYWETTNNILKVYDLGNTTWNRTTPTTSEQTNINTVAADGTDIGLVAGSIANVNTTAGAIANVNTTAGAITNVNNVGGSIANVNTVAGSIADVNRYAAEYTIAASAPGSPSEGDLWYDSVNNKLKYYTGSAWTEIAPGITTETDPSATAMALALGG